MTHSDDPAPPPGPQDGRRPALARPATGFGPGTLILTPRGEVAVEDLAAGDMVVTAGGAHRPIRRLAAREARCDAGPDPWTVWPIRIRAGAFGVGQPAGDLLLAPDHAVCVTFVEEVLVPLGRLLNGATVARDPAESVVYRHVELDGHDILIANGLPVESGPGEPEPVRPEASCRPVVASGPVVDMVRMRLVARAGELGLRPVTDVDVQLVFDGQMAHGFWRGNVAAFHVPSLAHEVRLRCRTFVPDDFNGLGDRRTLGVAIWRLSILASDGGERVVEPGDGRLREGFFAPEEHLGRSRRWSSGEALLPCELWEGLDGILQLRIEFDLSNVRAWR